MLSELGGVELVAVADPSPDAAAGLAEACGAPETYGDAGELLAATAVDALYVCVPPFAHGPPERAALAAGVPFFVEKPLGLDEATAVEIGAEVERTGLVTAAGYHWRNLDTVDRARSFLAGRPPRLALAAWLDKVPPVGWWTRRESSGGQTIEQTTHLLDVLLDLVGDVEEVQALGSRTQRPAFPDSDVDDVSAATLRFASGAVGSVASTCLLAGKHRAGVELYGDGYALRLTEDELVIEKAGGEVERMVSDGAAKRRVDADFLAAIRAGDPALPRAPYASALRTHRLACALARSAERASAATAAPAA